MPLGLGMDIVDVVDIEDSLRRFGDRYLRRVYTQREIADCADGTDARRLATHFAAKEAALKSLPIDIGDVDLRSVEVRLPGTGEPTLELSGAAADAARGAGIVTFAVSVGATRRHAAAVVVAEGATTFDKEERAR
ncbi:MAG: holo-[acyl-carrier-protein] synthase [Actinobacteria bacterium]|nr:MAG: holo-[acyl-carrier-protein] synthase [Actinomycetota bacterium]